MSLRKRSVEDRIEGTDFGAQSETLGRVLITGMAIADFRTVVNCVIYNSDGKEIANAADSVESYANRMGSTLSETIDTIVKFGASSYYYFH